MDEKNDDKSKSQNLLSCLEKPSGIDAIVIVIAIGDESLRDLPAWLEEIRFNNQIMSASKNSEGVDPNSSQQSSLGQRRMHELHFERLISQSSVTSSLTSDDVPLKELPDTIPYFSGIPAIEVTQGIIHLFRDKVKSQDERSRISEVLCVLGVPAHVSLSDFLNFVSPSLSLIHTIQVVRDSTPNQYMILLKFKDKKSAEEFYLIYNMKRYNSMERRVCQLVFASHIEVVKMSEDISPLNESLTELPSCPVCLERLDESVLTILCNHSFHTHCLTRWEDSTCPVCRYTQVPEPSNENTCNICESKEDLWICLICGNVGCGRYHGGHAHDHFVQTQHTFCMQLGTQRVWDYIGDNYVHRLVQNKEDGKLVEIEGSTSTELNDVDKIDSLQLEYTYLLTSQLESQRLFFEEKLTRVEQEFRDQVSALETRCRTVVSEKENLEEKIEEQEKDRRERDKKLQQLQVKLNKVSSEFQEEKQLNKCLSDNQRIFREKMNSVEEKSTSLLKKKDEEIQELKEQVKDLMFSIEVQQRISEAPIEMRQEIQEGHIITTEASGGTNKRGGRRKGRHS